MAYSSGFNPHPRISYAGAAPTGSASEAEYLELALAQVLDPAEVQAQLDESLPPGLDVLAVAQSPGGSLADLLEASVWRIDLSAGAKIAQVESAVVEFLAASEVLVERMTKKGLREFDCRAAVVSLELNSEQGEVRLDLVLRHGTPSVRPDDVLRGLKIVSAYDVGEHLLMTRLAQGSLTTQGEVIAPLTNRA